MIKELVMKNRSYRRFYQDEPVSRELLLELVDLARLSASSANRQPLKYIISNEPEKNARIFPNLSWAGYLKGWDGPQEGERPVAYIIVLGDKNISQSFGCDHGIAAQSILLGAVEKGLGGCIIGSIRRPQLAADTRISSQYEILLVIALGKPREQVVLETVGPHGDIQYWRDDQSVHHVPKRPLSEIVIG